jgi:3-oxoadipate enol-lactonase
MTTLPTVDLTVYPYECDAFGHLNHASVLTVLERARWESLARGPGMDVFHRNGIAPVVRKATVDYRAPAFPGDVLRVESVIVHRGTTSWTIRQTAKRGADGATIAAADIVFVCVDRAGRPTALPEEVARVLGPRSGAHAARIAVDDVELTVDVRGSGAAVLFVHGFPFDRTMWRHQLAALSRWKRVAPDMRGIGESSAPGDGYSIARYADDLIGVLDALEIDRAVVCGLSMGGYIALDLMRRYAARVSALILCDTRPEADTADARRGRDELIQLALDRGAEAVGERLLPRLLAAATFADQPEVVEQYREMTRRVSVPGMVGALRAMRERPDSTPWLDQIRVPTLVIVGSEDQVSPPAVAETMVRAIPGAALALIPAAGHLAPLEQPLATSRVLEGFLEGAL